MNKFHGPTWCGLLMSALCCSAVHAASGDFDTSFGTAAGYSLGNASVEQGGGNLLIDASGRYVMAAYSRESGGDRPYLLRYTSSGLPDSSFGSAGKAFAALPSPITLADVRVLRSASTLYLIASAPSELAVYAFDGNGAPILGFGSNGKFAVALNQAYGLVGAAMQGSRLLFAGSGRNPANNNLDFLLLRVTAAGALDSTFGVAGWAWSRLYSGTTARNRYTDVAIQSDGKVVTAGRAGPSSNTSDFVVARYSADGLIDPGFGAGGFADYSLGGYDLGREVALQSDGKVIVGGVSCAADGSNCQPRILRLNSNGVLDSSYGSAGVFATTYNYGAGIGDLAVDGHGRVIAAGYMQQLGGQTTAFVLRLTATGLADSSFSSVGTRRMTYSGMGSSYFNQHAGVAVAGTQLTVSGSSFSSDTGLPMGTVIARLQN